MFLKPFQNLIASNFSFSIVSSRLLLVETSNRGTST